jgi:hypothetical protein
MPQDNWDDTPQCLNLAGTASSQLGRDTGQSRLSRASDRGHEHQVLDMIVASQQPDFCQATWPDRRARARASPATRTTRDNRLCRDCGSSAHLAKDLRLATSMGMIRVIGQHRRHGTATSPEAPTSTTECNADKSYRGYPSNRRSSPGQRPFTERFAAASRRDRRCPQIRCSASDPRPPGRTEGRRLPSRTPVKWRALRVITSDHRMIPSIWGEAKTRTLSCLTYLRHASDR